MGSHGGDPGDPMGGVHGIPGWALGDPLALGDPWALGTLGLGDPWALGTCWPLGTQWPLGTRALGARAHGPRDKVL